MEEMLAKFQSDLGSISSEIRSLQEQSQSMSLKLRNRKAADRGLSSFLDSLALPLPLIQGILAADLDHDFKVPQLPTPRGPGRPSFLRTSPRMWFQRCQ